MARQNGGRGMVSQITYPVICSWCERKGIYTVVNYSTDRGSHGICKKCRKQAEEEVAKQLEEYKKATKPK